jgi:DNA-binding response OmpR family regulator
VADARVLIVDDDPLMRRLFERAMSKLHVEAVVVGTGDAAHEAARAREFTLALIDLALGPEDGREVATRIRPALRGASKLVCITGSSSLGADAAGVFDGFEPKPATVSEMSALLSRWL